MVLGYQRERKKVLLETPCINAAEASAFFSIIDQSFCLRISFPQDCRELHQRPGYRYISFKATKKLQRIGPVSRKLSPSSHIRAVGLLSFAHKDIDTTMHIWGHIGAFCSSLCGTLRNPSRTLLGSYGYRSLEMAKYWAETA